MRVCHSAMAANVREEPLHRPSFRTVIMEGIEYSESTHLRFRVHPTRFELVWFLSRFWGCRVYQLRHGCLFGIFDNFTSTLPCRWVFFLPRFIHGASPFPWKSNGLEPLPRRPRPLPTRRSWTVLNTNNANDHIIGLFSTDLQLWSN